MIRGHRKQGRKTTTRPTLRPNLGRQLGLALAAVAALGVGYLAARLAAPPEETVIETAQAPKPAETRKAWYKSQDPPPALISEPDTPIFPEPNGIAGSDGPRRAYEEALPSDVFDEPPAPPLIALPASPPQTDPATTVGSDPPPPAAPPVPALQVPGPQGSPIPAAPPVPVAETWRQYALAVPDPGDRPMIAVVIDDMGMDRKRSARVTGLPGPLTLSFLTYADDLAKQGDRARSAGHELMLHVSMEPTSSTVDPGPNVLLASDPPDEIRRRLVWGLERFGGFVGINNHMGSKFTENRIGMDVVMAELKARGLLFLDSRTTPKSIGAVAARQAGVPAAQRNVFLDNVNEVAAVKARLAETERVAKRTGAAIAIGHPRDATLQALAEWVPALSERGFVLVPLSAIVRAAVDGAG
jgi:uncharacterized protein